MHITLDQKLSYRDQELAVKIAAENRVNAMINRLFPQILANAQQLMGREIFKQGGALRVDAKKILNLPETDHPDSIYLNRSTYSLGFTFKTCVTASNSEPHMSDHCHYAETTCYIGDIEHNQLTGINEHEERKDDYSLEIVKAQRAKAEEAKKDYEEARSACFPFNDNL